nr:OmpA family protein [Sphingomicrobium aestuariivivum]
MLLAAAAIPATAVAAQPAEAPITINGELPTSLKGLPEGPKLEGFIASRRGGQMLVAGEDGARNSVLIAPATKIRATGGFLGLGGDKLAEDALLAGVPVTVKTVQWGGGLVASQVKLSNRDLETAWMIRNGTAQRFEEHETLIADNAAKTEALRGRFGDIDQYNLKGSTNVYFDTAKWNISQDDIAQLCATADEANAMNNALLLVVGYTDSVGDEDYNQVLSERRAGKVVNTLQQKCGWAPYRMLTPTGMAEADPAADNETEEGKALNRRVEVNILVSKAVDGMEQAGL